MQVAAVSGLRTACAAQPVTLQCRHHMRAASSTNSAHMVQSEAELEPFTSQERPVRLTGNSSTSQILQNARLRPTISSPASVRPPSRRIAPDAARWPRREHGCVSPSPRAVRAGRTPTGLDAGRRRKRRAPTIFLRCNRIIRPAPTALALAHTPQSPRALPALTHAPPRVFFLTPAAPPDRVRYVRLEPSADPSLVGDALAEFFLGLLCAQSGAAGGSSVSGKGAYDPGDLLLLMDGAPAFSPERRAAATALNRLTEAGFAVEAPAHWRRRSEEEELAAAGAAAGGKALVCCAFGEADGLGWRVAVVFLPRRGSVLGREAFCPSELYTGAFSVCHLPPLLRLRSPVPPLT